MCLAIPGQVIEIDKHSTPLMGVVNFGGIRKQVCLDLVPEVKTGEYVIVHVGFAISKLDEKEALQVFEYLSMIDEIQESGDEQS